MNLLFFGDSIVQGLWDEQGGWPDRIKQEIFSGHLEKAVPHLDYNMVYLRGVSGDTSEDLRQRIGKELKDATDHSSSEVNVVFSVGINDCGKTEGENKVSREDYRENLIEIVDQARKCADRVIAVGLTPVDEERLNGEESADHYTNSEVKRYEDIICEVCEEKDVKFVPVFEKLIQDDEWNENLFDGLHPDTEGHRKIYELVKDEIIADLDFQYSK
ncbi:MAG: SGNH/GDSL hydrolase family protein [Candidatus Nanohalobium sp.]